MATTIYLQGDTRDRLYRQKDREQSYEDFIRAELGWGPIDPDDE